MGKILYRNGKFVFPVSSGKGTTNSMNKNFTTSIWLTFLTWKVNQNVLEILEKGQHAVFIERPQLIKMITHVEKQGSPPSLWPWSDPSKKNSFLVNL
jgi:hypothetical protein